MHTQVSSQTLYPLLAPNQQNKFTLILALLHGILLNTFRIIHSYHVMHVHVHVFLGINVAVHDVGRQAII